MKYLNKIGFFLLKIWSEKCLNLKQVQLKQRKTVKKNQYVKHVVRVQKQSKNVTNGNI